MFLPLARYLSNKCNAIASAIVATVTADTHQNNINFLNSENSQHSSTLLRPLKGKGGNIKRKDMIRFLWREKSMKQNTTTSPTP